VGLLLLLMAVMSATVLDYGMSGDEGVQHRYGRKLVRWYATLGTDPSAQPEGDIAMYGGFFEIVAECAVLVSPLDVYETRHVVTLLFAFAAFAATWRMGATLGGEGAGFVALALLALTPPFYGHCFNNPKDVPFAATFGSAAAVALVTSRHWPRPGARRLVAAGVAIGLAAGTRVAGLILFGLAGLLWAGVTWIHARASGERMPYGRFVRDWLTVLGIGWVVMVAFWPPAWSSPLLHPFRAWGTFSQFWADAILFFDGKFVLSGEVTRFYLPRWFTLTMPETYLVALLPGVFALVVAVRHARTLDVDVRRRLWQGAWVVLLAVGPVGWVVLRRTPLYDGLRHFLFVMPFMAAVSAASFAAYLRARARRWDAWLLSGVLAAGGLRTLVDMVQLHPYQTVYFNRLVAGGLRHAATLYETDYWCLTFKEGTEWLQRRFEHATCHDRIRVAGHSTQLQTSYYLRKTEGDRELFKAVGVGDEPHFVMATSRYGDHLKTPGHVVHIVERQQTPLMWIFEVHEPPCDPLPGGS
jgi:hypothetical protein